MELYQKRELLLLLNEDLRELMEGVGITHLLCEGRCKDCILTLGLHEALLQCIDAPQDSYILTPQILIPLIEGQKDTVNYERIPLTEERVCYPIDCNQLHKMYAPDEAVKFYVFINEHHSAYLTRGLQYVKTKVKFIEQ